MNTRKNILRETQKNINLPGSRLLEKAILSFSKKEKVLFFGLFLLVIASVFVLLLRVNNAFLAEIPLHGGTITEGVVGTTPPKINPVATSPYTSPAAENDLIMLVYSGLMKVTPEGGLMPDLAEGYTISEDALTYTFTLKNNLVWHDGEPITSEDIEFTVQMAQDSEVGSRNQASWDGVKVEAPDQKTVVFTLNEPYAPFLQNTTMGILPKHLWESVHPGNFATHPLNTHPIGSGPFMVESIKMNKDDTVNSYVLKAFKNYALGEPFIENLRIRFFANEEDLITAYKNGEVTNINSITPEKALVLDEHSRIERIYLPRIFSAFFNQNEAKIFSKKEVRQALNISVSRKEIVNQVLYGYATEISGPIPPGSLGYIADPALLSETENGIQKATVLLEEAGWEKGDDGIYAKKDGKETVRLSFSISTTKEAPELYAIAEILKARWSKVGAEVTIKTFETKEDLKNLAIRPRKYDILLFGEIIGVDGDPYAFWHSSQRLDPGLNIASYTNLTVNAALEKGRKTTNRDERIEQYQIFQKEIQNDVPAVFLYAPQLIYATNDSVNGMRFSVVNAPGERLANVHTWFLKTERVWRIFAKNKRVL